jgi:cephalosporin hydroxylase
MLALAKGLQTDKGTDHSYLCGYEVLFREHRLTANNVLEIGIKDGGSILLWKDYFCCATVHGIDILPSPVKGDRILTYQTDAYLSPPVLPPMDIIIDDGSHKKEHMVKAIELYLPLLTDKGIFVIEDIPDPAWVWELRQAVPLDYEVEVYDWRLNKGRHDDILFVVRRASK